MDKKNALIKAQALCSQGEKCSFDIEKKLKSWSLSSDDIDNIMGELISEKYIDDKRYACAFALDKFRFNKWGKVKISHQLRFKNIDTKAIQEALQLIPDNEYEEILKSEISKKRKSIKDTDPYSLKNKLIRFATSRGFENGKVFDIVTATLEKESNS